MGQKSSKSVVSEKKQPDQPKYNPGRKIIACIPAVTIECNLLDEDDVVINVIFIRYEREIHQFLDYTSYTYVLKSYVYSEFNKTTTEPINYKLKKDCFFPDSLIGLYHRDKSIFIIKRVPIPVPVPVPVPVVEKTVVQETPPTYQESTAPQVADATEGRTDDATVPAPTAP